jgi:hypothetical protein
MEKINWISVLKNQSLNERDEHIVVILDRDIVTASIEVGGKAREDLKAYLKERIVNFINDADWKPKDEELEYCVQELSKGHASNIGSEDFWWHTIDMVTSISKPTHVHRCRECGGLDVEQKYWVNPNTMEIGEWCEEDDCWCNHCQEMQPYEVVQTEELEVFDGKLGVRFKYNGKDYSEVIDPALAESDPDLDNVWQYRIDSGDENVRMVLRGNYLMCGDECCGLSTTMALQVKVEDVAEGEQYIDDIDII